jgi:GDPmannose 4,6-dehydratase
VTRKITIGVAKYLRSSEPIELGNLNALRDWGHARDYVEGMWRILQQEKPDDYVLATGKQYSVRQFVEAAFGAAGRRIIWHGSGPDEYGTDTETGAVAVRVNPRYYRPAEVETLLGDPTKAVTALGWTHRYSFEQLVKEMVTADIAALE